MITVLSLFDGLGGARVALDRLGIPCLYFASETDRYAMSIANKNYSDIIQLGDITGVDGGDLSGVDLLIGGSPCQGFSKAGHGLNFSDPRSSLFFEFVRILNESGPKYFLLENVKMKAEWRDIISGVLGVEPAMINSSLVTAQNRVRYYWTNIPGIEQPEDRGIYLRDVIEVGVVDRDKSYTITKNYRKASIGEYTSKHRNQLVFMTGLESGRCLNDGKDLSRNYREGYRIYSDAGKAATPTSKPKGGPGGYTGPYHMVDSTTTRKLTPLECERLQGLPDGYTAGVSNTQRYRMIGNGFTIPVIEHILHYIKGELK